MQTEIRGGGIIWQGCVNNSMAWQGAGERVMAGEKEIERETEREMRNQQKKNVDESRRGGDREVEWVAPRVLGLGFVCQEPRP